MITAFVLALNATYPKSENEESLQFKLLLLPIFVVAFTLTFGSRNCFETYMKSMFAGVVNDSIDYRVPALSVEAEELLASAVKSENDSLVYSGPSLMGKLKNSGEPVLWLPVAPEPEFCILPVERQREYVSRFLSRHPKGGWLLISKAEVNPTHCVNKMFLDEHYRKTEGFESRNWELERYVPRSEKSHS